MKYCIYILLSTTLFLQGCKAQSKIMEDQNIILPEIDNKFEKFDIETFKKEKKGKKRKKKEKQTLIEEDIQSYGYISRIYYDSSYFKYNKLFYNNLGIKQKGIIFNNGSQYGTWYEFDEQGNLIKEIDTDKGYDFGWEQVIAYCEKNKIQLTKGYATSGFQTTIYKEESEQGNNIWKIEYQSSGDQTTEIILDGITGKELDKKIIPYENN